MRLCASLLALQMGASVLLGCEPRTQARSEPASPASPPPPEASPPSPAPVAEDAGVADAAPTPSAAFKEEPGMRLVPAGTFTMGANEGGEPDERPAHPVTLAAFYLDVTEVTQEAYATCVQAGACKPAKQAYLQGGFAGANKPVVGVNQAEAETYCRHVGKRLPREAEFERAIRGDDARMYPWGNEPPTREHAVFSTNFFDEVGARPKGRGPFGHDDLAGNVWEWMADPYDPYAYVREGAASGTPGSCEQILETQNELRREGRQGFTGSNPIPNVCEHAIRGGAYNMPAKALRATNRVHHPGSFRLQMTGIRCAKDATAG